MDSKLQEILGNLENQRCSLAISCHLLPAILVARGLDEASKLGRGRSAGHPSLPPAVCAGAVPQRWPRQHALPGRDLQLRGALECVGICTETGRFHDG